MTVRLYRYHKVTYSNCQFNFSFTHLRPQDTVLVVMSLFCVLVALIFQQSLTEIVVEISQPNGQRILDIAEIYMQQNGRSLPDYLTTLSFSSATDPYNDVQFCKDNNVLSSCQNAVAFNASSSRWEGEEERPTLFILSRDAFFGELVSECPRIGLFLLMCEM